MADLHTEDTDVDFDPFKRKRIYRKKKSNTKTLAEAINEDSDDDSDRITIINTNTVITKEKVKSLSWKDNEKEWVINRIITMMNNRTYYHKNKNNLTDKGYAKLANDFTDKFGNNRSRLCVEKRVNTLYEKY